MPLLALALAFVMGLSLGLLGGGGSILTVPILVYVVGIGVKPAVAMSLAVVGSTSAAGAASHAWHGNVRLRPALMFAPLAMAGTFLGARLAAYLDETAQLVLFGSVMLLAAGLMFRRREARPEAGPPHWVLVSASGLVVGVLTGLIGVGGGFLIVPALVLLAGVPMHQAVGTSLLVIALNAAAGLVAYAGVVKIPWRTLLGFALAALAGALFGARLARRVSPDRLRRGFAILLMLVAIGVLYEGVPD